MDIDQRTDKTTTYRSAPAIGTWKRRFALIASLALASLGIVACGNGGITGENVPQMAIAGSVEGEGGLTLSPPQGDDQGEPNDILIRSIGQAPLTIENIELTNVPQGISYAGEIVEGSSCVHTRSVPGTNDEGGTCDEGQFCDDVTPRCRVGTVPETPFDIQSGNTRELEFIRLAMPVGASLDCQDAPDDVPSSLVDDYCGSVTIQSNARQGNEYVSSNGEATIYLQADTGSGRIDISGADFNFEGVEPGESVNDNFTITNIGNGPLTISNMRIDPGIGDTDFSSNFEISTSGGTTATFPIEIPADTNNSQQFTLTFNAPGSATPDELNFQHFLEISSSSITELPDEPINVTSSVSTGPIARFSSRAFTFGEQSSQTLTISNEGTESLRLNSISFEPADAANHYTVLNEGSEVQCSVDGNGQLTGCNFESNRVVQAGSSKQLTIQYSSGVFDTQIAELGINHSDPFSDGYRINENITNKETTIHLLGTQDGGLGRIRPGGVQFAKGGDSVRSKFAILRNVGTSAYNTDEFQWLPDPDNPPPEFFITEGISGNSPINSQNAITVQPGTLTVAKVNYDPSTSGAGDNQGISAVFDGSNNLGPNPQAANCGRASTKLCVFNNEAQPRPTVTATITTDAEGDPPQVPVGQTIDLSATSSTHSAGDELNYYWMTLDRPADSQTFINPDDTTGRSIDSIEVRPDRPGEYTILLGAFSTVASGQTTFTFEGVASSN